MEVHIINFTFHQKLNWEEKQRTESEDTDSNDEQASAPASTKATCEINQTATHSGDVASDDHRPPEKAEMDAIVSPTGCNEPQSHGQEVTPDTCGEDEIVRGKHVENEKEVENDMGNGKELETEKVVGKEIGNEKEVQTDRDIESCNIMVNSVHTSTESEQPNDKIVDQKESDGGVENPIESVFNSIMRDIKDLNESLSSSEEVDPDTKQGSEKKESTVTHSERNGDSGDGNNIQMTNVDYGSVHCADSGLSSAQNNSADTDTVSNKLAHVSSDNCLNIDIDQKESSNTDCPTNMTCEERASAILKKPVIEIGPLEECSKEIENIQTTNDSAGSEKREEANSSSGKQLSDETSGSSIICTESQVNDQDERLAGIQNKNETEDMQVPDEKDIVDTDITDHIEGVENKVVTDVSDSDINNILEEGVEVKPDVLDSECDVETAGVDKEDGNVEMCEPHGTEQEGEMIVTDELVADEAASVVVEGVVDQPEVESENDPFHGECSNMKTVLDPVSGKSDVGSENKQADERIESMCQPHVEEREGMIITDEVIGGDEANKEAEFESLVKGMEVVESVPDDREWNVKETVHETVGNVDCDEVNINVIEDETKVENVENEDEQNESRREEEITTDNECETHDLLNEEEEEIVTVSSGSSESCSLPDLLLPEKSIKDEEEENDMEGRSSIMLSNSVEYDMDEDDYAKDENSEEEDNDDKSDVSDSNVESKLSNAGEYELYDDDDDDAKDKMSEDFYDYRKHMTAADYEEYDGDTTAAEYYFLKQNKWWIQKEEKQFYKELYLKEKYGCDSDEEESENVKTDIVDDDEDHDDDDDDDDNMDGNKKTDDCDKDSKDRESEIIEVEKTSAANSVIEAEVKCDSDRGKERHTSERKRHMSSEISEDFDNEGERKRRCTGEESVKQTGGLGQVMSSLKSGLKTALGIGARKVYTMEAKAEDECLTGTAGSYRQIETGAGVDSIATVLAKDGSSDVLPDKTDIVEQPHQKYLLTEETETDNKLEENADIVTSDEDVSKKSLISEDLVTNEEEIHDKDDETLASKADTVDDRIEASVCYTDDDEGDGNIGLSNWLKPVLKTPSKLLKAVDELSSPVKQTQSPIIAKQCGSSPIRLHVEDTVPDKDEDGAIELSCRFSDDDCDMDTHIDIDTLGCNIDEESKEEVQKNQSDKETENNDSSPLDVLMEDEENKEVESRVKKNSKTEVEFDFCDTESDSEVHVERAVSATSQGAKRKCNFENNDSADNMDIRKALKTDSVDDKSTDSPFKTPSFVRKVKKPDTSTPSCIESPGLSCTQLLDSSQSPDLEALTLTQVTKVSKQLEVKVTDSSRSSSSRSKAKMMLEKLKARKLMKEEKAEEDGCRESPTPGTSGSSGGETEIYSRDMTEAQRLLNYVHKHVNR